MGFDFATAERHAQQHLSAYRKEYSPEQRTREYVAEYKNIAQVSFNQTIYDQRIREYISMGFDFASADECAQLSAMILDFTAF